jgi:hypothetical protein
LSVVAAALLLVPLPSQWRARNITTLTLILSTILLCIVITVNAVVWDGHTRDMAPAWCDFGQLLHIPIDWALTWNSTTTQPPLLNTPGHTWSSVPPYASANALNGLHHFGAQHQADVTR